MGKNKPFTRRWKLKNNSVVLNKGNLIEASPRAWEIKNVNENLK